MPTQREVRPFSGNFEPGVKFQPKKILQSAALQAIPDDQIRALYGVDKKQIKDVCLSSLQYGKSINNVLFSEATKPTILPIGRITDSMPQPKKTKKQLKEEKEAAKAAAGEAEDGGEKKKKKKKKKKGRTEDLPEPAPWVSGPDLKIEESMAGAYSWNFNNKITNKFSSGVAQTLPYLDRISQFSQLNKTEISPVLPHKMYVGEEPNADDPYLRRKVQQLNDVEVIQEKPGEKIAVYRRQAKQILDEENLSKMLNKDLTKLNLEAHYWLSGAFISRMSNQAPNLTYLCLRRLPSITNQQFADLFAGLTQL